MRRVSVSLEEALVKAIDREAAEARSTRGAVIRIAVNQYVEDRREQRAEAEKQREMDDACHGMDALAEKLGRWDPVRVIRRFRGDHAF